MPRTVPGITVGHEMVGVGEEGGGFSIEVQMISHIVKKEKALIINAFIINSNVLELLLIVGYLPMQYFFYHK